MKAPRHIPGPTLIEFLRSLPGLRNDTLGYLDEAAGAYGDIVRFPLGRKPAFFFNHPDAVAHVLVLNARNYNKQTLQFKALSTVTGTGLATAEGELWLRQRRMIQPAFSRSTDPALVQTSIRYTRQMLDRWVRMAKDRQPVDIQQEMLQLSLQIVCQALFQVEVDEPSVLTQAVLEVIDTIVDNTRAVIRAPHLPWSSTRKTQNEAREFLERTVESWITRKSRASQATADMISTLLNSPHADPSHPMQATQVRDEVMTFIIAGHETVASALVWSMINLAQQEALQEEIAQQVRHFLARQELSPESLASLPAVRRLVEETLRLYPPVWLITRRSAGDDRIMGHTVPEGSLVIISPFTLHRHPGFWQEPDRFDPNRFQSDHPALAHRYQYIPFGAGPRLCIGGRFAMLEVQTVIALVLGQFHLSLPAETPPLKLNAMVTLRPAFPVHLDLTTIPFEKSPVNPAAV